MSAPNPKVYTIIGATGLIGSAILGQLLDENINDELRILVRRPYEAACPSIKVIQVDFTNIRALEEAIRGSDVVFCTVGSTRAKTPDLEAYRRVDFDIPVTAARISARMGVQRFMLVSAVAANSKSKNFYSRMKGETEEAVLECSIPSIYIYRPSLLLGKRNELRPLEKLASWFIPLITPLLPSIYKPIKAITVAKAMIRDSANPQAHKKTLHYREMI
jgi:uncharacterized protein YbjT (DUF2867 family)